MTHWTPQQPGKKKKKKKRTGLKVAGAAVAALVVLGCTVTTSDGEEEATPRPQSEVALIEGTPGDGPTLSNLLPPSESELPREFDNALRSGQRYLDFTAFSYDGLYNQLTSEYGEGFTPEAAQYAVDNVDVDWNAEAVESAESYLEFMPMSRSELLQQLTSEYGEGFTPEQAEYAVNAVY